MLINEDLTTTPLKIITKKLRAMGRDESKELNKKEQSSASRGVSIKQIQHNSVEFIEKVTKKKQTNVI